MNRRTLVTVTTCVLLATQSFSQNTNTLLPYGNVGIGTLLPTAKLQVNGSTLLQGLTVTGASVFQQNSIFNNQLSVVGATVLQGTTTIGQLKLPSLTVQTSPSTGMQILVRDPSNGTVLAMDLNDIPIVDPYVPDFTPCPAGAVLTPRWSNAPNKIYVGCPQVNVGIGTSNPTQALHVTQNGLFNGSLRVDQSLTIGLNTLTGSGHLKVRPHTGTAIEVVFVDAANTTVFKATNGGNYTPFLLEANGRMTVSNGTRKIMQLNPDGTLLTRTVQVDAVAWPDYVFETSYKLMTLEELEAYIQQNKHLPNVPSASVAETNGIDLGQMNKVLLEKTEEMTLYILQQQKQLDAQQQQIEELKGQMQQLMKSQH